MRINAMFLRMSLSDHIKDKSEIVGWMRSGDINKYNSWDCVDKELCATSKLIRSVDYQAIHPEKTQKIIEISFCEFDHIFKSQQTQTLTLKMSSKANADQVFAVVRNDAEGIVHYAGKDLWGVDLRWSNTKSFAACLIKLAKMEPNIKQVILELVNGTNCKIYSTLSSIILNDQEFIMKSHAREYDSVNNYLRAKL